MKTKIVLSLALTFSCAIVGGLDQAHAVGASTPFTEIEAESGALAGGASIVSLVQPLSNPNNGTAVLEASGAAYVQLTGTGQSVSWVNNTGQNVTFINLRAEIPDAPNGYGTTNTLDLYVNGTFRQAISLNSAQTYVYGANPTDKNPADGGAFILWDEFHFFVSGAAVAPGSTIMLKQDSSNTAGFYHIDLIDLENPPAALSQPANSLSITSYGAIANSPSTDNATAIQNCINAAQSQGESVWIPQGIFYFGSNNHSGLSATGVTIEGAGMWYSRLYNNPTTPGQGGGFFNNLVSCTLQNVDLDGNAIDANSPGAMDVSGSGWTVNSVWVSHLGVGFWGAGNNGTIENMRINNTWGDGINLNNFTGSSTSASNDTIENNFVRFVDNDAIAINGTAGGQYTAMSGITVENNTIGEAAGRLVNYGGNNVTIENNYCHDLVQNDGIQVGYHLQSAGCTNALVEGNLIVRCGNPLYGGVPGMLVGTESTNYNGNNDTAYSDQNITVTGNTILDPYYGGFQIQIAQNVVFQNNLIESPGMWGVDIINYAFGNATIDFNIALNVPSGYSQYEDDAGSAFHVTSFNNSWQTSQSIVPPTNGALYQLVSASSGMALDNAGSKTAGTDVTQWTVNNGNLNQEWLATSVGSGYYNLTCQTSDMNLDNGDSTTAGTDVTQWTINSGNINQYWKFTDVGGGYYNINCDKSGMNLDNGGSTTAGSDVIQYTANSGNLNQYWNLQVLPQSGHYYHLICARSGMALDNAGSTTAGTAVTQWTDNAGNSNQLWQVVSVGGGYYNLVCQTSGMALDNGGSTTAGTDVTQYTVGSGNINQYWEFVPVGGGYYNLVCEKSGMNLDNGGSTTAGTDVTQYTNGPGNINQWWRFEFVK